MQFYRDYPFKILDYSAIPGNKAAAVLVVGLSLEGWVVLAHAGGHWQPHRGPSTLHTSQISLHTHTHTHMSAI